MVITTYNMLIGSYIALHKQTITIKKTKMFLPLLYIKGPTFQILKQCAVSKSKVCTSAIAIFLVTAKCRISTSPSDEH